MSTILTHSELKEPSLYSAFRRLEQAKLIESYWGEESQGGRRKYYRITSAGTAYYQNTRNEWEKVKQIMDMILTSPNKSSHTKEVQ